MAALMHLFERVDAQIIHTTHLITGDGGIALNGDQSEAFIFIPSVNGWLPFSEDLGNKRIWRYIGENYLPEDKVPKDIRTAALLIK